MGFGYVVVAGVAVIVTVFILQNTDPATVRFLMWRNDALPLALLLLGSVVAGLLVAGVPLGDPSERLAVPGASARASRRHAADRRRGARSPDPGPDAQGALMPVSSCC